MALNDLDLFREELPEAFLDQSLPSGWEDDWIFVPVGGVDQLEPGSELELDLPDSPDLEDDRAPLGTFPTNLVWPGSMSYVDEGVPKGTFPGAPSTGTPPVPPPDALAFYLPVHYFHPTWWGIYLIAEGVQDLATYIWMHAGGVACYATCVHAARVFLYCHEAFHHRVECFAIRLETTHRTPVYRTSFEAYFQSTVGKDTCVEEALASAAGYQKTKAALRSVPREREAVLDGLDTYIRACPPGYRRAPDFYKPTAFRDGLHGFAEVNHEHALPKLPAKAASIWRVFPHAFTGIGRVTSRVNYLVRRDSSLARRTGLGLRYLRYRDVAKRLKKLGGCAPAGGGKGSHERWKRRDGRTFVVSRHPGDIARGTLAAIIKQAGLSMSVHDFATAKV